MTGRMVKVEWADLTGTGFSPQRRELDDGLAAYWAAAETLLHDDLSQPPEGIRRTGEHPLWTLRRVPVGDTETWCFVVQGRRGPYGVAGTCRFGFAPVGMKAYESWGCGVGEVAERPGWRGGNPSSSLMKTALGGVLLGRHAIPIAGPPADSAAVIQRILGILPDWEARQLSWSACLLQPPGAGVSRVIAGHWPAEFEDWEPDLLRAVSQVFAAGAPTDEQVTRLLGGHAARHSFDELVALARRGTEYRDWRRGTPSLLDRIRHGLPAPAPVHGGRRELSKGDRPRNPGAARPAEPRRARSASRTGSTVQGRAPVSHQRPVKTPGDNSTTVIIVIVVLMAAAMLLILILTAGRKQDPPPGDTGVRIPVSGQS